MSYQALYRAWRPKVFHEVIGQGHITETIKNQIKNNNIAHAYLFSGTRGTGKTSTAKIMARAINCLSPVGEDPCNTCEICTGMLDESLMDIVEIDAASNNGVDDIRELRENVKYPPARAKYKVYIVDEVHMLSQGAFNALLKTLEEPPSYVVFILATTEPHKIPATIHSRCQRYDFKRINGNDIVGHLDHICKDNGIEAEEAALKLIVRNADGAMRDAISILDQCTAFVDGTLKVDDVIHTLGMTTEHWLFKVTDQVIEGQTASVMKMIDELVAEGKDIHQFIRSLTNHFRSLMLARSGADLEYLLDATDDAIADIQSQSERLSMAQVLRGLEILSALEAASKWATQPRIHLEMGLIKLMQPEVDQSVEALLARIERLESGAVSVVQRPNSAPVTTVSNPLPTKTSSESVSRVNKQTAPVPQASQPVTKTETNPPIADAPIADEPVATFVPAPADASVKAIQEKWSQVLDGVRKRKVSVKGFLIEGEPAFIENGTLMIAFKDGYGFHMDMIERAEHRAIVEEVIQSILGYSLRVKCEYDYNLKRETSDTEVVEQSEEDQMKAFLGVHADKLTIVDE